MTLSFRCHDCERITSGDCGKHAWSIVATDLPLNNDLRIRRLERIVKLLIESGCHCKGIGEWPHEESCKEIRRLVKELE
jgi:hypothetical protein